MPFKHSCSLRSGNINSMQPISFYLGSITSNIRKVFKMNLDITYNYYSEDLDIEQDIYINFDYQAAESMTRDYPGCSEDVSICNVEFEDEADQQFINEVLKAEEKGLLKEQALEEMIGEVERLHDY